MTCSTWNVKKSKSIWWTRQYSQRPSARRNTNGRVAESIITHLGIRQLLTRFGFQQCDESSEGDVARIFRTFLCAQSSLCAFARKLVDSNLELGIRTEVQHPFGRFGSQAEAQRVYKPIEHGSRITDAKNAIIPPFPGNTENAHVRVPDLSLASRKQFRHRNPRLRSGQRRNRVRRTMDLNARIAIAMLVSWITNRISVNFHLDIRNIYDPVVLNAIPGIQSRLFPAIVGESRIADFDDQQRRSRGSGPQRIALVAEYHRDVRLGLGTLAQPNRTGRPDRKTGCEDAAHRALRQQQPDDMRLQLRRHAHDPSLD